MSVGEGLVDFELDLEWFHPKSELLSDGLEEPLGFPMETQHHRMDLAFADERKPISLLHPWEMQTENSFVATDWDASPQHPTQQTQRSTDSYNVDCFSAPPEVAKVVKATKNRKRGIDSISASDPPPCCRCSGGCRNSRCACVKAWRTCGQNCKCTNCRNPFKPMEELGVDYLSFKGDTCLIHNLSKIKSMRDHLLKEIEIPCCHKKIQVKDCLPHVDCAKCNIRYTYSWCNNKLCDSNRPRNHCNICKRCGDYRDRHCEACGHCYFAGVTGALKCPCKQKLEDSARAATTAQRPKTKRQKSAMENSVVAPQGVGKRGPSKCSTVKCAGKKDRHNPKPPPRTQSTKAEEPTDECCIM